jgi:hypothetical protein
MVCHNAAMAGGRSFPVACPVFSEEGHLDFAQFLDLLFDIQLTGPVRGFKNSNPV